MSRVLYLLVALLGVALGGAAAFAQEAPLAQPPAQQPGASAQRQATSGGLHEPGLIDLNTASASELESLPGIGQGRAQAILTFRAVHGGFQSVSQLLHIKGIGRALLRKLRPLVTLSAAPQKQQTSIGSSELHRVR